MFEIVKEFEKRIADYYNAPFAVATDSCTHALELSFRYDRDNDNISNPKVTLPTRTYVSVPMTLMKLNIPFSFVNIKWKEYYFFGNTRIVDAAVLFTPKTYINGQLMCLSFQHKKMLGLGRGGAILCPNEQEYNELKKMAYDGRDDSKPWAEQNIKTIGYHYYMTPETAQLGIEKIKTAVPNKLWTSDDYPYLPEMEVFRNVL